MRTALVYAGEARTIRHLIDNHRWFLFKGLSNFDIFASVEDNADADDMLLLKAAAPHAMFHMEKVKQPDFPDAKPILPWSNGYPPSVSPDKVLRQLWALNRAWQFVQSVGDYENYIRVRTDANFCRYEHAVAEEHTALMPWWGRWGGGVREGANVVSGGVNDRFGIFSPMAAQAFFTTFTNVEFLQSLGCPLHPETIIGANLEHHNISIRPILRTEFTLLRKVGSEEKSYPIDATSIDIADYVRNTANLHFSAKTKNFLQRPSYIT